MASLAALTCWGITPAIGAPDGFIHLRMVDKTIVQDIRYATRNNFIGKRLSGYQAGECILARPVANGLRDAQKMLKPLDLGLLVYDCYRPAPAVRAMVRAIRANRRPNALYHPNIPANQLMKKGYVASRSGHSSGGSVDLTLIHLGDGKALDMGTRFDFFDPASHTRSSLISKKSATNRKLLVKTMARAGFTNYRREWWHFRFAKEPYRGRHFDFPITNP
ncbi:MAG: M15 family metallopeptidase [Rhizobiaceae bacterium]